MGKNASNSKNATLANLPDVAASGEKTRTKKGEAKAKYQGLEGERGQGDRGCDSVDRSIR